MSAADPHTPMMMMDSSILLKKLEALERASHLLRNTDEMHAVPGIVVVGSQSSGKSSVLESATGLAFPRSEGMCTRVPAVVTVARCAEGEKPSVLVSTTPNYDVTPSNKTDIHETAAFDFDDSDEFETAIVRMTEKLSKRGWVQDTPIYIKLLRTTGPTYTLTDLPGITCISKTQVDVEQMSTALTRKYMANENALILVVLPAAEDFHNSKALRIAQELDPTGQRTIGVVTKIDNLPPGSDILNKMSGIGADAVSLEHGFFAVRNRTQAEVNDNLPISEVREREEALFLTDMVLSQIPSEHQGMQKLIGKICEEQARAIDRVLPNIKANLKTSVTKWQTALHDLPQCLKSNAEKRRFLMKRFDAIARDMQSACEARPNARNDVHYENKEAINLSARVHEEIKKTLYEGLKKDLPNFLHSDYDSIVLNSVKNSQGYNLPNFPQADALRSIIFKDLKPVLKHLAPLTIERVQDHVKDCFLAITTEHVGVEHLLPSVYNDIVSAFQDDMEERTARLKSHVNAIIKAECRNLLTNNDYYYQTIQKFREHIFECKKNEFGVSPKIRDNCKTQDYDYDYLEHVIKTFKEQSNESAGVHDIQISLKAYTKVVRKRFSDTIGILIKDMLVTDVAEDIGVLLQEKFEALLPMLEENMSVLKKRATAQRNIDNLSAALKELEIVA